MNINLKKAIKNDKKSTAKTKEEKCVETGQKILLFSILLEIFICCKLYNVSGPLTFGQILLLIYAFGGIIGIIIALVLILENNS